MELSTIIRIIYAVNFSIIMSITPLLYILNHPQIFKIGFDEYTPIYIYSIPLTFIAFKNIARFTSGLAIFNDYIIGKQYHKNIIYFLIYLTYALLIELYIVCYSTEINIYLFAFIYICKQYLYSSIDFSLDQIDINYNQNYRVIGLLVLLIPLYGIIYQDYLLISLKLLYFVNIISLKFSIYCTSFLHSKYNKPKKNKKDIHLRTITTGRISIDKFIWIFMMLLLVSYIDSAGDAIATEKLWNNDDTNYFIINMSVRIFASLITFPPIQNKFVNQQNSSTIIIKLMMVRFLLLISMKYISFKGIIFFIQSSIDIFVGTMFMNDYLNKNKKIFRTSTTTSKYYVPSSVAYFINENVPPLIKMMLVYNLIRIGKNIDIGTWFIFPIMIMAIISINLIPIIQKKIKSVE